jgi:cytochrome c oxidase subunit IV
MAAPSGTHDPSPHDTHGAHPHIVPVSTYLLVFGALMVLTGVTVWVATLDFGAFNTVVAMAIAITKASLVVLFFMHVKYSPSLTKLLVAASFIWLALMVLGTLVDYYSPNLEGKLQPASLYRE